LVFFNKVFGATHPVTVKAKALLSQGVAFEVSLYNVKATVKGKAVQVNLTYGTTALMKGTADAVVLSQNKKLIEEWIGGLYNSQGSPVAPKAPVQAPVQTQPIGYRLMLLGVTHPLPHILKLVKAVHTVTGGTVAQAKQKVELSMAGGAEVGVELGVYPSLEAANLAAAPIMAAEGHVQLVPVNPPVVAPPQGVVGPGPYSWAKPVDKVIDLKEAKALGQKVHGTSTGSVYHTVAFTDHVKVAARLYKSGSISIRAEWTDNPVGDLKLLAEAGLQMKPNYGSIHFDAQDVPLPRVIGAFLLGTGIEWTQVVTKAADLVIAEYK
jgi:hypothetical protein